MSNYSLSSHNARKRLRRGRSELGDLDDIDELDGLDELDNGARTAVRQPSMQDAPVHALVNRQISDMVLRDIAQGEPEDEGGSVREGRIDGGDEAMIHEATSNQAPRRRGM